MAVWLRKCLGDNYPARARSQEADDCVFFEALLKQRT